MFKEDSEPTAELGILERETPLTIEEIAEARSEDIDLDESYSMRRYNFADTNVSVLRHKIYVSEIKGEEHKNELFKVLKSRENGEVACFEKLLVNVLVEQARIAEKFGLPQKAVYGSMKLEFDEASDIMMNQFGDINVLTLNRHVGDLKKMGASDEQIITEVSGHVFHEAIHIGEEGMNESLLGGKSALGEVTSITGQLAYYLEKGYQGPKGYDTNCSMRGRNKIDEGNGQAFDHEIATSVSAELLFEQLRAVYPEIAGKIKVESSLDACEAIVAKIPVERKEALMPCLKAAILQSTDEGKFKEVVDRLKSQNTKKK